MSNLHMMANQPFVDLYIFKVYALTRANDPANPFLVLSAKKRRDLDPFANNAGDFVMNQMDTQEHHHCVHVQPISLVKLNQILIFNHKPKLSWPLIRNAVYTHTPLIGPYDNVAFRAHVDVDLAHPNYLELPSYRIDWESLNNPSRKLDYQNVESMWDLRASKTVQQLNQLRESYWTMKYLNGPKEANAIKFGNDFKRGQYLTQIEFLEMLKQQATTSNHDSHDK